MKKSEAAKEIASLLEVDVNDVIIKDKERGSYLYQRACDGKTFIFGARAKSLEKLVNKIQGLICF
jgi:hypothetical protein